MTTRVLLKIKGFSDAKVEKVKDAVRKCLVSLIKLRDSLDMTNKI